LPGYPDSLFAAGVERLEGGRSTYTGRQAWLANNGYTAIVNPTGIDEMSKIPSHPVVGDITGITFRMSGIGYFDTYAYSWKLHHVDVRANNRALCTANFDSWIGPGEESGSAASRTIKI